MHPGPSSHFSLHLHGVANICVKKLNMQRLSQNGAEFCGSKDSLPSHCVLSILRSTLVPTANTAEQWKARFWC